MSSCPDSYSSENIHTWTIRAINDQLISHNGKCDLYFNVSSDIKILCAQALIVSNSSLSFHVFKLTANGGRHFENDKRTNFFFKHIINQKLAIAYIQV